jgi:hypothetical protein
VLVGLEREEGIATGFLYCYYKVSPARPSSRLGQSITSSVHCLTSLVNRAAWLLVRPACYYTALSFREGRNRAVGDGFGSALQELLETRRRSS